MATTETAILRRHVHGLVTKIDRTAHEIELIPTRLEVDGDGEVVVPGGVDLTRYERNPVLLLQHNPEQRIGRMVSPVLATVRGADALVGRAVLRDAGVTAEVVDGTLNGVSIGFRSLERGAPILPGQTGPTHTKTELLEVSLVTLPSCASCTVIAKAFAGSWPTREPLVLDRGALGRLIHEELVRSVDAAMPKVETHIRRALLRHTGRVD